MKTVIDIVHNSNKYKCIFPPDATGLHYVAYLYIFICPMLTMYIVKGKI